MSCFVIIIGPPAVGKMTVGQELAKRTGIKLFHNHLVIDALLPVFDFDSPGYRKLVREFRTRVFEEAIQAQLPGLIFTFVTAFNHESCVDRLFEWINMWKNSGATVYVIELRATLDERLKRNETANRLYHKHAKRDIERSRKILLQNEEEWVMESPEGLFLSPIRYCKIDTTRLSCEQVVDIIMSEFEMLPQAN